MKFKVIDFDVFFNVVSYFVVLTGFLSLCFVGALNLVEIIAFVSVLIAGWKLEKTRSQISNSLSNALVMIVIPVFFILWKFKAFGFVDNEIVLASFLGLMILILAAIKILQKKKNKDWVFLYLISFFEVVLAAGLSISPLYIISLILFLLTIICAVIAFEIKKTFQLTQESLQNNRKENFVVSGKNLFEKSSFFRLPKIASLFALLSIILAVPIFFLLPRTSGSNFNTSLHGLSGFTGFSDSVSLGAIGLLKQNDGIVMRVKVEKKDARRNLHWRGVALDFFDNKNWQKSKNVNTENFNKNSGDFFLIGDNWDSGDLLLQTIYLEPIDSNVLFSLANPVAVQANFQNLVKDSEGALNYPRTGFERISYKVYSNFSLPDKAELQTDNKQYTPKERRYLQLPSNLDERIGRLANELTVNSKNKYDKAKIVEGFLQNNFGYTLELKPSGEQPLADFLFNIREGHCEYFATAMAVMLRTQGIATRLVNGFQEGEYNETADVYVVRQKNAHSWVEVYFPEKNVWIPFDPTPVSGQNDGTTSTGILGKFNNYIDAIETFWIQYFVAYDNQEQKTLFRSAKSNFNLYKSDINNWSAQFQNRIKEWWKEVRGDAGVKESIKAIGFGIGYLIAGLLCISGLFWLFQKISQSKKWRNILRLSKKSNGKTIVEFYEKMQIILTAKGLFRQPNQTPLEFAFEIKIPEAIALTEKYNDVRFGKRKLSIAESREIEQWLGKIEEIGKLKND